MDRLNKTKVESNSHHCCVSSDPAMGESVLRTPGIKASVKKNASFRGSHTGLDYLVKF